MNRLVLAALLAFATVTPLLAENGENDPQMEADQDACFGSDTQDACENNVTANCTWVTKMEGETPVSWCEMTLPWTPKE